MSSIATGQGHDLRFDDITASSAGNNTIVAGIANRRIKVVSYALVALSGVTCSWVSTGSTVLSGPMPFLASGGICAPSVPSSPWFATPTGEGLNLNLSGAIAVGGHISYLVEE